MHIYTNRPVNRVSRRAHAAERRVTFAAVMLTFSIIITLATVRRLVDGRQAKGLPEAAALAYAAVNSTKDASDSFTEASEKADIIITDIIA